LAELHVSHKFLPDHLVEVDGLGEVPPVLAG
jgi:hypothetical protein